MRNTIQGGWYYGAVCYALSANPEASMWNAAHTYIGPGYGAAIDITTASLDD